MVPASRSRRKDGSGAAPGPEDLFVAAAGPAGEVGATVKEVASNLSSVAASVLDKVVFRPHSHARSDHLQ